MFILAKEKGDEVNLIAPEDTLHALRGLRFPPSRQSEGNFLGPVEPEELPWVARGQSCTSRLLASTSDQPCGWDCGISSCY